MVYYKVRSWYISQANQVGYEKGGGTINYVVQLKSYSFDQVVFIVWIKFFPFEKYFSFLSLISTWLWLDTLIYIEKFIFQKSIPYKIDIFCPSGPIIACIWAKLKLVRFYRYFSLYNFKNLNRTLCIWSWFLVHMCKMMTPPDAFFIFSKFWFCGLLGGWKGKNWSKMTNILSHSMSQELYLIWLWFLVYMCKMISPLIFFIFKIFHVFGGWERGGGGQKDKKWHIITNFSLSHCISQEL